MHLGCDTRLVQSLRVSDMCGYRSVNLSAVCSAMSCSAPGLCYSRRPLVPGLLPHSGMLFCQLLHCAPIARCSCTVAWPYGDSFCYDTLCMWYACRLLHHNMLEAKRIVASPAPAITRFAEEQSPEQRDHIFDELNTLAVIYRKPSSSFTNAVPAHKEVMISVSHCETSRLETLPNQFCCAVGSVAV